MTAPLVAALCPNPQPLTVLLLHTALRHGYDLPPVPVRTSYIRVLKMQDASRHHLVHDVAGASLPQPRLVRRSLSLTIAFPPSSRPSTGSMGEPISSIKCTISLSLIHGCLTRSFTSLRSVNVTEGEPCDRPMTTGQHTVRDISCIKCNTVLGWKYASTSLLC